MRHARDRDSAPAALSHTPIYDTLYSEYLRAFRALPGDRTGEEDHGFTAFSYGGSFTGAGSAYSAGAVGSGSAYGGGSYASGWNGSAWQTDPWPAAYAPAPQPSYAYAGSSAAGSDHGGSSAAGSAYGGGRQHQTGMQHIPAALPPAPRRGY
ncbi:hypothetical protein AB0C90_20220 [Streptomyces sp. NPDC048550]|uniref:hypothetical protein n=1 Tax=unclassified Streptomyces TaxID=2593676 RepID=UPI002E145512|nr:hypothetical protein OG299_30005 [Streptomyces sp. NBC_01296]WSW58958.1 hypothetical protein OG513_10390 [Streptomyces sp. NBC_00998]